MEKFQCNICGYIYDPVIGDIDNGISLGVSFDELPVDWICPVCGAEQDEFERFGE